MATEGGQGDGRWDYRRRILRTLAVLILFPFLWIGVALNFLGAAERLSFLPGVSDEGGIMSGFSVLVLTLIILAALFTGLMAATGADVPDLVGDDEPKPAPTPEPTATATPTPTPSLTPTAAPTPIPIQTETPEPPLSDLDQFEANYRDRIQATMENDSLTGVPILATGYREMEDGTKELWIVYWECDKVEYMRDQRAAVAVVFANTAGHFKGEEPDRLRAYGVMNLETYNDTITYIPTSSAELVSNRSIDPDTYTKKWVDRMRYPTASESEIAFQMAVNESGQSKAETAFKEHYTVEESDGGCPAGAEGVPDDAS